MPTLHLGRQLPLSAASNPAPCTRPIDSLTTHAVVLGATGCGKTGLLVVLVEEALRAGIPVLVLDVKGDLPDLALRFADDAPAHYAPWIDPARATESAETLAARLATDRTSWSLDPDTRAAYATSTRVRVLTPGCASVAPVHVLSSLERVSPLWSSDPEAARETLGAAVSLVLRLLDRNADPASSREHVLLSVLAERHLAAGRGASLEQLIADLDEPPIETVGAMSVDTFLPAKERRALACALNALLASPSFAAWRSGESLDPGAWLTRTDGPATATVVSVAHLDDDERQHVIGMVLAETLAWVRTLPGSSTLRALVVFDEVYGFLPPHPANPPAKRPMVTLLKQARAFGVGVVLATQNPMDVDYRALSNAGTWFVGKLATDADRARVVDALDNEGVHGRLDDTVKRMKPRWFVLRDPSGSAPVLVQPRSTLSWLRGPMTRAELRRLKAEGAG